jgi:hypothetical protein
VQRFIDTAKDVLMQPGAFFRSMRREGGLGPPLVYAIIGTVIGSFGSVATQMMMPWGDGAGGLAAIVFAPVFAVIGLFIGGAILHVLLILVAGSRQSFETTFRLVAYTSGSTSPLALVPVVGGLAGAAWALVILILGAAEAHEVPQGRAAIAVILPALICCGLAVLAGGALLALIFGAAAAGLGS